MWALSTVWSGSMENDASATVNACHFPLAAVYEAVNESNIKKENSG
jgi:hypothetical protein